MEGQNPAAEAPAVNPTAAPVAPPAAITPPPAAEAPKTDVVTMSLADWQKAQSRLEQYEREIAAKEQARLEAEEKAAKNDMEKGRYKEATERLQMLEAEKTARAKLDYETSLKAEREQSAAERSRLAAEKAAAENARNSLYQRAQRYALDGELSRALAGHNLVPGGAEQLSQLWRSQNMFTVTEDAESFAVRATTGQGVADFVAAQLAGDQYAHFLRAGGPAHGGTARPGANPSAAAPHQPPAPEAAPQPRTLGEAAILQMQSIAKAQGDARTNMGLGFGLKAAAR